MTEIKRKAAQQTPQIKILADRPPQRGLKADIEIIDLAVVNGASRFLVVALAGNDRLGAKLSLNGLGTD